MLSLVLLISLAQPPPAQPDAGLPEASLSFSAIAAPAKPGDPESGAPPLPSALYRASTEASALIEVELPLITTERMELRWRRALKEPKVKALLATRAPLDKPESVELPPFEVMRSCLRRTDNRLTVKLLVFMGGSPLKPTYVPFLSFGLGLETTPGYEQLKAALIESFSWAPDRTFAVQRKALNSENSYVRHLAAEWLVQHEASAVVDEVWGAPGSETRQKNEATARVAPDCRG